MSAAFGSITSCAPNSCARLRRSAEMSTAMTRAPITMTSCVADNPTGPWPKMAIVSPPCRLSRFSAPHAVPVPHEIAAPVTKESESGRGTSVPTGTFMYLACAPCPARAVNDGALEAHLRPAGATVLAVATAVVVVIHHALADTRFLLGDAGTHRRHDAAWLVPGDHSGLPLDAPGHGAGRLGGRAIVVQVAAAHARGLDLEDHVSRPRCRIRELSQLEFSISEEHDAFHALLHFTGGWIIDPCGRTVYPLATRCDQRSGGSRWQSMRCGPTRFTSAR